MYVHIVAHFVYVGQASFKGGIAGCVFTTLRVTLTFHCISTRCCFWSVEERQETDPKSNHLFFFYEKCNLSTLRFHCSNSNYFCLRSFFSLLLILFLQKIHTAQFFKSGCAHFCCIEIRHLDELGRCFHLQGQETDLWLRDAEATEFWQLMHSIVEIAKANTASFFREWISFWMRILFFQKMNISAEWIF